MLIKIFLAKIFGFDINLQAGNYENFQFKKLDYYFSLADFLILKYLIISFISSYINNFNCGVFVNYFIKRNKINKIMLFF